MGKQENEEDFEVSMEEDSSGTIPVGSSPDDIRILEAVLFASDELLTAAHLKSILPGQPDARKIRGMVEKINVQLQKERHPFEVVEIGGGYQFRTITYYHPWVRQIFKEKASKKLSIQSLECLAIIAYKQPISKAEIEAVRGVVSDGAMKTLLEKRLVTVSGRSDKPGRPLLYGTTQTFLTYFGLNKIEDLPRIEEFEAMAREKMEDLSLDELAAPQVVVEEGADGSTMQVSGNAETVVPPPVESSVFELELTADEKSEEPSPADAETVDASDDAIPVRTPGADPVSIGDGEGEDTVPIDIGKVGAADKPVAPTGELSEPDAASPESMSKKASPQVLPVEGETAFDLESIIIDERTPSAAQAEQARKERRSELEGMVLRGETAFDLEAIVIEDPQINFPPSAGKKTGGSIPAEKPSVNETAFDIDLMPKAPPKKQTQDVAGSGSTPATQSEQQKQTVDTNAEFEFNAPFEASDGPGSAGDAEDDVSFEPAAARPAQPGKAADTAFFEVGTASGAEDDPEACDRLAEELKETAFFLPDGTRKNAAGKVTNAKNNSRKKTFERGDGKKKSGQKPPAGTVDTSEKPDGA